MKLYDSEKDSCVERQQSVNVAAVPRARSWTISAAYMYSLRSILFCLAHAAVDVCGRDSDFVANVCSLYEPLMQLYRYR